MIRVNVYLYKDSLQIRFGLVLASEIVLTVAVIFAADGVPIMWIDIVAMGYSLQKTWDHYAEVKSSQERYNKLK